MMKIGPVGCKRTGEVWDHRGQSKVVQIFVSFGPRYLNSLRFQYVEKDGNLITSEIIGRQSFTRRSFRTIELDYPHEYIIKVTGFYTSYIEKLTILTNKRAYECKPFEGGHSHLSYTDCKWFELEMSEKTRNQFGGFHGTHNSKGVRSIGVYLDPISTLPRPTSKRKRDSSSSSSDSSSSSSSDSSSSSSSDSSSSSSSDSS